MTIRKGRCVGYASSCRARGGRCSIGRYGVVGAFSEGYKLDEAALEH